MNKKCSCVNCMVGVDFVSRVEALFRESVDNHDSQMAMACANWLSMREEEYNLAVIQECLTALDEVEGEDGDDT